MPYMNNGNLRQLLRNNPDVDRPRIVSLLVYCPIIYFNNALPRRLQKYHMDYATYMSGEAPQSFTETSNV